MYGRGISFVETIVAYCAALALTILPFFSNSGGVWTVQGMRSPVLSQRAAMRAQVSFAARHPKLPLRPELEPDCSLLEPSILLH